MGYEKIKELISDIDAYHSEAELREILQQIYFICEENIGRSNQMLENDETLTKNTIIGQANIINELSDKLRDKDGELREIKIIRRNAETKNCILMNTLKKIELLTDRCDGLTFFTLLSELKSILDEATKQL